MDNKRMHQRYSFPEPVGYQASSLVSAGSVADNISLGGIKLSIHEFIPLGTLLELQVRLSNPFRLLQVRGKVVWIRESVTEDRFDVGLEFIKDDQVVKTIGEYLNARRIEST